jgi:hypothetical protein
MVVKWLLNNISKFNKDVRTIKVSEVRPFNLCATIPITKHAIDAFKLLKDEVHSRLLKFY